MSISLFLIACLAQKYTFLAKNPPLWIFNLNFSYKFLFNNLFCTYLPNFRHIPLLKVKLWPFSEAIIGILTENACFWPEIHHYGFLFANFYPSAMRLKCTKLAKVKPGDLQQQSGKNWAKTMKLAWKLPFFRSKSAIMDFFFSTFFLKFYNFTTVRTKWNQNQVNPTFLFRVMVKNACNYEK